MQAAFTFSLQWMREGNMTKWYSTLQTQIRHFLSRSSHFWKTKQNKTHYLTQKRAFYIKAVYFLHFHTHFLEKPFLRHPMGNCSTLSPAATSHTNQGSLSVQDVVKEAWLPGSSSISAPGNPTSISPSFISVNRTQTQIHWEKNVKSITKLRWSKIPIFSHCPHRYKINKWICVYKSPHAAYFTC